tara:strand:- start:271 stop:1020 length:750 start_codon:yes stop_codon:yes gene_type:complete
MKVKIRNINILGIKFVNLNINQLANNILNNIKRKKIHISTVNAAKYIQCKNDKIMQKVVKASEIITIDGMSFIYAGKILKKNSKIYRVSGYDLMEKLFKLSKKDDTFFFLGSKEEIVNSAVKNVKKKYKNVCIKGYNNGFFWGNEKKLIKKINILKPRILLISITSPLQEIFVNDFKSILKTNVIILLGGSFEVLSGKLKRAPVFIQKIGMEWLFRLMQEPRRLFWRYITTNSYFIYLVFKEFIKLRKA